MPGKKTLLGFQIDGSELAVAKRENPSGKGYADPEDLALLEHLRILYKAHGIYKKHPLFESNPEEIRQFFRWALSNERHPLPPIVRRILCLKRAYLTESIDSMRTVPGHRTTERVLLAEIDKLLHDDGVRNVENRCMVDIRPGFWSTPKLPSPPVTVEPPVTCPPAACGPEDVEKLKTLQEEAEELRRLLAQLTEQKQGDLLTALQRAQTLEANGNSKNREIVTARQEVEELRKQIAEAEALRDTIDAEAEALRQKQTMNADALLQTQEAAKAAQDQLRALQESRTTNSAARNLELAQARREAEAAQARAEDLQQQLASRATNSAARNSELAQVRREAEAAQARSVALEEQLASRATNSAARNSELAQARREAEAAQARSVALEEQLESEIAAKNAQLAKERLEMKKQSDQQIAFARKTVEQAQEDLRRLQSSKTMGNADRAVALAAAEQKRAEAERAAREVEAKAVAINEQLRLNQAKTQAEIQKAQQQAEEQIRLAADTVRQLREQTENLTRKLKAQQPPIVPEAWKSAPQSTAIVPPQRESPPPLIPTSAIEELNKIARNLRLRKFPEGSNKFILEQQFWKKTENWKQSLKNTRGNPNITSDVRQLARNMFMTILKLSDSEAEGYVMAAFNQAKNFPNYLPTPMLKITNFHNLKMYLLGLATPTDKGLLEKVKDDLSALGVTIKGSSTRVGKPLGTYGSQINAGVVTKGGRMKTRRRTNKIRRTNRTRRYRR